MYKVMIVDDNMTNLIMAKKVLEEIYEIVPVSAGKTALEFLHDMPDPPDIMLLDIDMPIINGFNLAERVSNNLLSQENATIIYITTYENLVYEAFKYSPLRFIRKNRINEELLEAIQAFLKKSNLMVIR